MTVTHLRRYVIPAAYDLLPAAMQTIEATALLVAIAWQESRLSARKQVPGTALGYWQFEISGINGVLAHPASSDHSRTVLKALDYPYAPVPYGCHQAVQHHDVLAACFARLLLWTLPGPLAARDQPDRGWALYTSAWRPGKPRPTAWAESWAMGWS